MPDFIELRVNLTVERRTGDVSLVVIETDQDDQWRWVADHEFGPFDTTLDLAQWLTRTLAKHLNRPLR